MGQIFASLVRDGFDLSGVLFTFGAVFILPAAFAALACSGRLAAASTLLVRPRKKISLGWKNGISPYWYLGFDNMHFENNFIVFDGEDGTFQVDTSYITGYNFQFRGFDAESALEPDKICILDLECNGGLCIVGIEWHHPLAPGLGFQAASELKVSYPFDETEIHEQVMLVVKSLHERNVRAGISWLIPLGLGVAYRTNVMLAFLLLLVCVSMYRVHKPEVKVPETVNSWIGYLFGEECRDIFFKWTIWFAENCLRVKCFLAVSRAINAFRYYARFTEEVATHARPAETQGDMEELAEADTEEVARPAETLGVMEELAQAEGATKEFIMPTLFDEPEGTAQDRHEVRKTTINLNELKSNGLPHLVNVDYSGTLPTIIAPLAGSSCGGDAISRPGGISIVGVGESDDGTLSMDLAGATLIQASCLLKRRIDMPDYSLNKIDGEVSVFGTSADGMLSLDLAGATLMLDDNLNDKDGEVSPVRNESPSAATSPSSSWDACGDDSELSDEQEQEALVFEF